MRRQVLIPLLLAGALWGSQQTDAPNGGAQPEQTKFTAEELGVIAGAGGRAFVERFAGKTLDIRGTTGRRSIVDGVATVEIGKAQGRSRYQVICRATGHASLQAAAVMAANQEIRVSGSAILESGSTPTILISPCTILTNNVRLSPTQELSEPYAKKQAEGGPSEGRYRCGDEDTNTGTGWLQILPRNRYTHSGGEPGRFRYDEKLDRVFFQGGSLGSWQANFTISADGRILALVGPDGTRRRCRWLGAGE